MYRTPVTPDPVFRLRFTETGVLNLSRGRGGESRVRSILEGLGVKEVDTVCFVLTP